MESYSSLQGNSRQEDVQARKKTDKSEVLVQDYAVISCRTRCGEACKSPCCPLLPLGQPLDTWYLDSLYILTLNQSLLLDLSHICLNFSCGLTLSLSFPAPFLRLPISHLLHLLFS